MLDKGKKIKRRSWSRPRPSQGGRGDLSHLVWGRGEEEGPATQLGTWVAALGRGAANALLWWGALGVVRSREVSPLWGVVGSSRRGSAVVSIWSEDTEAESEEDEASSRAAAGLGSRGRGGLWPGAYHHS